jgi:Zn-dependent peptidase ImmA (M78 family)/transcriptional regulator with XRE-family HTH domain
MPRLQPTAEVLVWAREAMNLSIEQVAVRMRKDPETIASWEEGKACPTFVQLEKLAKSIYKIPSAVFFFPEPPEIDLGPRVFRSASQETMDLLGPEVIGVVRRTSARQDSIRELWPEEALPEPLAKLDHLQEGSDLEVLARSVRRLVGVSIDDQTNWRSPEVAVDGWRNAFEGIGIFVLKDAFHQDDVCGFSLFDHNFPVICLNNSLVETRQIFTLAHEMGHLLIGETGIDVDTAGLDIGSTRADIRIEYLCHQFAAELLLPSKIFRDIRATLEPTEENVSEAASELNVSRAVVLRRYLDAGDVTWDTYRALTGKWRSQVRRRFRPGGGGDYYNNQRTYAGAAFLDLVLSSYYSDRITAGSAAMHLNMKVTSFHNLEAKLAG